MTSCVAMVRPILDVPRIAWSAKVSRASGGEGVVALITGRAQLVGESDGAPRGKPARGSPDADWGVVGDRLVRLDDSVVAVIDPDTGKPRHQVPAPGARRLIVVGANVFAWGKPDVHCLEVGADGIVVRWSAPCGHVRSAFVIGDRVVIGDVSGGKGATRIVALADGRELHRLPGIADLADEHGFVLDAGGAYVVTDASGVTLWRTNKLRPNALLGDAVVANQTQAESQPGPVVVLERATGELRVALPEATSSRFPPPLSFTQKTVAVADETIYVAEGVAARAQPIHAYDPQGRLRWVVEVTTGAGHYIIWLEAGHGRLLATAGSLRVSCLLAP
jgi:hypothetical protein